MRIGPPSRRSILLDFALVFLLTAVLIWPLFKAKYLDKWASIESTFIADARFLKEHWPHPRWQPLWYGGTRFDYIYPPALRYGTAAIAKFYPMTEARAYHLYIAFFYCLGIAGGYLLAVIGSGSRGAAWLVAAATAVLSPSFLFLKDWRVDSWLHHPIRLGVLVRYGEGPHMSAFAVLPLALVACYYAMRKQSWAALALAGALCALVVSNNFYGASALAIWFPILFWSLWITHRDRRMWPRAVGIVALSYGLTAFWLVPSYFRVTTENLKLVSEPGNLWSVWVLIVVAAVYCAVTAKLAKGRPDLFYSVFVCGSLIFFALNVLGNYFAGFRVTGEPLRMVPELDLAIVLFVAEGLRWLWMREGPRRRLARAMAIIFAMACFYTALPYVRRAWKIVVRYPDYQNRIEYQLTEWMSQNLPEARAMATGSLRFWYNAWFDLPQLGGGSDQGVSNQIVDPAQSQIFTPGDPRPAIDWMQALGVDVAIVHEKPSQVIYHDFGDPRKFDGKLAVIYDDHGGDVIFRVPRRFPGLARVVETSRIVSLPTVKRQGDPPTVRAYAEAVENGPDSPAPTSWNGTDSLSIRARLEPRQSVLVQVTYDPSWVAYAGGKTLPIRKDALGQMLIEADPGEYDMRLVFELPLENRIGRVISILSALAAMAMAILGLAQRRQRTG